MFKKQLVAVLVILASFSALAVKAADLSTDSVETPTTLAICDHNGDNVRNLSDVAIFAGCTDTFDVNGDNIHDLADVAIYASNNQNNAWCASEFVCNPTVVPEEAPESTLEGLTIVNPTLNICDHNGDNIRNLTDVAMFAGCTSTFDVDGNGYHDLVDVTLYASKNQDNAWCASEFVCDPATEVETTDVVNTLDICDHNGDNVRNLTDVVMLAECADTFDVNGDGIHNLVDVTLYASNNQDNAWCASEFVCDPTPVETANMSGGGVSAPDVSKLSSEISCEQVDLTWETSKDSLTWIVYGQTTGYGDEFASEDFSSAHNFSLFGLPYDTTYNYMVKTKAIAGASKNDYNYSFTTPSAESCGVVLGKKISIEDPEPKVLGEKEEVCTYSTPDEDVLGKTDWEDGTLLRGCGPEVYRIENQEKRHVTSFSELLNYIGERIYNVTNDILDLF
ncbi:hypothetical protein HON36_03550 [Candidatus Parcubacteria bacterium]|jgi:hypothetical protein|nr:hypothetical protein [Candidatus Parcubacteria bacterium]MBT7228360.1 hypothetical protein [Candidatus Parcubacteria bacterium]